MELTDSVGKYSYLNDNSKSNNLGRSLNIIKFVMVYCLMEN